MDNNYKLIDICNITTGKLDANAMVENGKYPFFTCDRNPYRIDKPAFDCECVLIGGNNATGNFPINYYKGKFNAYQRTYIITMKENAHVNIRFVYHSLKVALLELKRRSRGSLTKFLTIGLLENIRLPKLTKEEYCDIAEKIDAYDLLVTKNVEIITSLEQYSQLLFHKWFVDFNFPNEEGLPYRDSGGEMVENDGKMIPKMWKYELLSDSAEFINGLAMQKFPPLDESDMLPVIKIREINNKGFHNDTEYMTKSIDSRLIINDGDLLFPWSGSLSVNIWTGGVGGLNQHIFKVESHKYSNWFLYQWIKRHMRYFKQIAYGKKTTMGHINRQHLSLVSNLIPDDKTLLEMNNSMKPIYDKIVALSKENKLLQETRDLLIKKLIK